MVRFPIREDADSTADFSTEPYKQLVLAGLNLALSIKKVEFGIGTGWLS